MVFGVLDEPFVDNGMGWMHLWIFWYSHGLLFRSWSASVKSLVHCNDDFFNNIAYILNVRSEIEPRI